MEKEDGVAVGMMGMDDPGAERDAVGRGDGHVGEFGVEGVCGLAKFGGFVFGERAAGGVQRAVGEVDAADSAEGEIQEQP